MDSGAAAISSSPRETRAKGVVCSGGNHPLAELARAASFPSVEPVWLHFLSIYAAVYDYEESAVMSVGEKLTSVPTRCAHGCGTSTYVHLPENFDIGQKDVSRPEF